MPLLIPNLSFLSTIKLFFLFKFCDTIDCLVFSLSFRLIQSACCLCFSCVLENISSLDPCFFLDV